MNQMESETYDESKDEGKTYEVYAAHTKPRSPLKFVIKLCRWGKTQTVRPRRRFAGSGFGSGDCRRSGLTATGATA